jgi:hypothetical protein
MQTAHHRIAKPSTTNRSAVTNGSRLLEGIDGRSPAARRYRDLIHLYESEVGGELTEIERGLIKQAAALSLRSEQLQGAVVRGEDVDNDTLIRLSGEARRILASLRKRHNGRDPSSATAIEDLVA